ncbi:MAG: TonB-dependent receptor [Acidobacteriia bacterium]|nr:TonB-dependent receptor [Terriglobia bacterium]
MGTVTDPSGAVVEGAKVVITNVATNHVIDVASNAAGAFNSGALAPGSYEVRISAKGFSTFSQTVAVLVGNTASVNAKLVVGQESTVIEVQGSTVAVNTEQAIVQGVVTAAQVDNLPINGRNFLDLAQLEPGVQIQDGQNFDPTKAGFSSISFGGRFGRTARINVDGIDISDETVGTTTSNIPASAIAEFQLSQSSLDLSQDLTSSGAVNVTTKSGTNSVHGDAFGLFRDAGVWGASSPGGANLPLQRSQFGGDVGGPIIKDKLFFFADGERTKQDSLSPVLFTAPFDVLNGGFSQAFRESDLLGKVDYNLGHNARAFYRYTYFANILPASFGFGYSVYANKDYTRVHALGVDFNTGTFTHAIRFSYLKFQNQITDNTTGTSLPYANTGVEINGVGSSLYVGPNLLAPQSTPQSNHELKYDGSKSIHSHILRYGITYNRIQGGGFASFFGLAPRVSFQVTPNNIAFAAAGPFAGGSANPLNYPTSRVRYGNGLGFSTELPAMGFPAGGLGPDNRIGIYFGDSWKIKPNLTLSYGLRYDHDTGRTDSDLPADANVNAAFPGWGNKVNNPSKNFAPQVGIAWDPTRSGKTVIRAGAGLYYENIIYNNVLFDRPLRLQTGAFLQDPYACGSTGYNGTPAAVPVEGGTITPDATSCGNSLRIGDAIPNILTFWQQFKAGNPVDLKAHNPNYIGDNLAAGLGIPLGWIGPNYKTPVSVQMNIGIQRQITHGMILSVDFLRNIETRSLLGIDINHVGDVKNFDSPAAQAAIATTLTACGVGSIDAAIAGCPGLHPATATTPVGPATMADFADNGLTSDADFGQACNQALGVTCAFHGLNPNQGPATVLQPIGRSVYNALQLKLVENVSSPMRGIKALNLQFAYSLSRFENSGGLQATGTAGDSDQDFVLAAADNNVPNRYFGPALLDRTHQISFGGYADAPAGFRLGLTMHMGSPQSSALVVQNSGLGDGEIFRTDFTGDGTIGDPMPGTHLGEFGRGINASNINQTINRYNTTVAGQATPAGQVLISNGLMTLTQLQALNGVAQPICPAPCAPGNQVGFSWLKALDLRVAWRHTFHERFTIEPSVTAFNVLNFANFNLPPSTMSGIMTGSPGAINGTTPLDNENFRVGNGTGVYAVGAARQVEWGLKFTF